jgi:predicted  nucleic acid-binding Zn-ribbon protein
MSKKLYSNEEILAAANEMAARGEDPTTLGVYAHFGKRGSLNRIQDVLAAWVQDRKDRAESSAPATPLPTHAEEVVAAWAAEQLLGSKQAGAKLWTLAHVDAEATLGPLREELAKEKAEAVKGKADSRALVEAMEAQVNDLTAVQEDLEGKLVMTHETIGSLRKESEAANERVRETLGEMQVVRTEAALIQAQNHGLDKANQRLETQVQEIKDALLDAKSALAGSNGEIRMLNTARTELQSDLKQSQSALAAAEKALAKAEEAHDSTRADLMALKVEIGSLRAELNVAKAATKKS